MQHLLSLPKPQPFSWCIAPLLGTWMQAFYGGIDESTGKHKVQFSDDSDYMLVNDIVPYSPQNQDDIYEHFTGCRFAEPKTCKCPDCKHNQII